MGETKALFVPLSCISACAACCWCRLLSADEPSGVGGESRRSGERGGATCPMVARGSSGGGGRGGVGTVAMGT